MNAVPPPDKVTLKIRHVPRVEKGVGTVFQWIPIENEFVLSRLMSISKAFRSLMEKL